MKRHLTLLLVLAAVPVTAFGQAASTTQTSGRISSGAQQLDNNTNSSKFTEYRDLRDNVYLLDFKLAVLNPQGLFFDLAGTNVSRRDQRLRLSAGDVGSWRLEGSWNEIPHLLSNKAQSPYLERTPGVLEVPQTMVIPFRTLNTVAANAPAVLASDTVIAAYAAAFSRPIALGTQTNTGTVGIRYDGVQALDLSVDYTRRTKTGSRPTYGPVGDRPPRTLNIELAEPVDYRTGDLKLAAGFDGGRYQARVEYLFSDFSNRVDDLLWQNVYARPQAGASFDTWDRLIGAYGRRPLPPDNRYHNATLSAGVTLPLDSRLAVGFSYGLMTQDQSLLPYAYQVDTLVNSTLPRATADARINTANISAEYAIAPIRRVNLRAFYRRFDLNNETASSQWQYATSDASNVNGTVTFKNKRVNLPYAWDRQTVGGEATVRLGVWRSSLGAGFERDDIGREYREAETSENVFRANLRAQPAPWVSLRAKWLHGERDGGTYDWTVTRQSYWYTAAEAGTDNDNPQFTFNDHPDMRRYDVSDRKRDRVDVTVGLTPGSTFSLSATAGYQRDDFGSDVQTVQPLRGRALADSLAATPGEQLGLRRSERRRVSVDLFFEPAERFSLNASVGRDQGKSSQRSIEFNENNKQNPSAVATAELGPWTRATSEWTADFDERTWYAGAGGTADLVPGRVSLSANYTLSLSNMDIVYAGYGVTNWDGTPFATNHQFGFQTPPTVQNTSHVVDARFEFPLARALTLTTGYTFDYYKISDWQQEVSAPWYEPVGTELLLRDSSRSHQWGNRLFNLGRYLAPGYTAHLAYASFTYRF